MAARSNHSTAAVRSRGTPRPSARREAISNSAAGSPLVAAARSAAPPIVAGNLSGVPVRAGDGGVVAGGAAARLATEARLGADVAGGCATGDCIAGDCVAGACAEGDCIAGDRVEDAGIGDAGIDAVVFGSGKVATFGKPANPPGLAGSRMPAPVGGNAVPSGNRFDRWPVPEGMISAGGVDISGVSSFGTDDDAGPVLIRSGVDSTAAGGMFSSALWGALITFQTRYSEPRTTIVVLVAISMARRRFPDPEVFRVPD